MITSLFGCATKQDTINYLNNYVHKNISENCINIFSNQRYNEYIDTVTNIKYYGNTSAASIPLAMAEGVEQGKVKLGSTAILCGFGAGMTWGGAIVRLREGIC